MKRLICALFLSVCTVVFAGEPVSMFGLPLGGRLDAMPKVCRSLVGVPSSICWVGKPSVAKDGSRLGRALVPGIDTMPKWASSGTFRLTVLRSNVLDQVDVSIDGVLLGPEIVESTSRRFGKPTQLSVVATGSVARWDVGDAHIEMICFRTGCHITGRSPSAHVEYERRMEANLAKEAKRRDTM